MHTDDDPGLPCVHCGLCLDTCPTYRVLGTEADSPRGRIYIMQGIKRGELALGSAAVSHLDGCLGCLACETACPSGVSYGERIEEFRPRVRAAIRRKPWRRLVGYVASNDRMFTLGLGVAATMDRFGLHSLRRRIRGLDIFPRAPRTRRDGALAEMPPRERSRIAPPAESKLDVALLTGCVGDRLKPEINRAAVEVLHRNDIRVANDQGLGCCGALAMHSGDETAAREDAKRNVRAFTRSGLDRVVTTAAGCGAMIKDYGRLLRDDPELAEEARAMSDRTVDVTELLVEMGFDAPDLSRSSRQAPGKVVYHDACHLLHAAGVEAEPRSVIEAASGAPPIDLGENNVCCGSAGSYNLDHPKMGLALGARKAQLVAEKDAQVVAVGNVGCILQLERALAMAGHDARVLHPVELLAAAYERDTD